MRYRYTGIDPVDFPGLGVRVLSGQTVELPEGITAPGFEVVEEPSREKQTPEAPATGKTTSKTASKTVVEGKDNG